MSGIRELTDEALLQRASHAGRNMIALAILGTLAALAILAFLFAPGGTLRAPVLASSAACVACVTGLWMLAIAARRGSPTSVGIILGVMALQLVVSVVGYVMAMMRANNDAAGTLWYIIIGIAIIAALSRSQNVLIEMRTRGLWEQRFGSTGPSRNLVIVGGVLYALSFVGLYAGLVLSSVWSVRQRAGELRQAEAFLRVIKTQEAELMTAMSQMGPGNRNAISAAIAKVEAMDQEVGSIQSDVSNASPLSPILDKYRQALAKWRSGLIALQGPTPDPNRAKTMFESGDRLRREAGTEFDSRYTRPDWKNTGRTIDFTGPQT